MAEIFIALGIVSVSLGGLVYGIWLLVRITDTPKCYTGNYRVVGCEIDNFLMDKYE